MTFIRTALDELNLSERQIIFAEYLVKSLALGDSEFTYKYLKALNDIVHIFCNNQEKRGIYFPIREVEDLIDYGILNFLKDELQLKRYGEYEALNKKINWITASDLATYQFCPVAFSISRTFRTYPNALADEGSRLHEGRLLTRWLHVEGESGVIADDSFNRQNTQVYQNAESKSFFSDILGSKVIYEGHSDAGRNKFFRNTRSKFVGQPDYIFQNREGKTFVVEEKFRPSTRNEVKSVYPNHKVQLASYIHLIEEMKIDYGYILYWTYTRQHNNYHVQLEYEQCLVSKIERGRSAHQYVSKVFNGLWQFILRGHDQLSLDGFNPFKCAGCAYSMLCGHKTKRFTKVTYPYNGSHYHILNTIPFPEELRKNEEDKIN